MRFDAWGPLEIHNMMVWEGRRFGRSVAVRTAPPPRQVRCSAKSLRLSLKPPIEIFERVRIRNEILKLSDLT